MAVSCLGVPFTVSPLIITVFTCVAFSVPSDEQENKKTEKIKIIAFFINYIVLLILNYFIFYRNYLTIYFPALLGLG
ncbi:hypothetical protein D3C84_1156090 [compost metagenome]